MIAQILPVFLIIVFGFFLSMIKIAHDSWVPILNKYGLYIGFPMLIFSNLIDIDREVLSQQIPTLVTTIVIILVFMLIAFFLIKLFSIPKDIGMVILTAGYFGNIGYLGFPLITSVLPGSGATISIITAAYSISLFTMGMYLLETLSGEEKHISEILKQIISSPFIIAIITGMLVVIFQVQIPDPLLKTVKMIEASASPVVLIGLGIFMHRKISLKRLWKPIAAISGLKMIIFPVAFMLIAKIFPLGDSFDIAILEASMPVAITVFALSDRFDMNKELIISLVILTTLITPIVFPFMVSIL